MNNTCMQRFISCLLVMLYSTALAADNLTPAESRQKLANGAEVTYQFAPRTKVTDKYVRTTTLRKGNLTLSYLQSAPDLKEIDGHAWQIFLVNKVQKLHLPDVVCGRLRAENIIWEGDFIYVPGMSFCGTADIQSNDMAMYRITDTKSEYLGMISSTLNKPEHLKSETVLAANPVFEPSPYGGAPAHGTILTIALNKTRNHLVPDMDRTYAENQPLVQASKTRFTQYLAAASSTSVADSSINCPVVAGNPWSLDDYCGVKLGTLHHAAEIGAVLLYTGRYDELNALLAQLRQSPVIHDQDIDKWKELLQTINPESTAFLFWRTGPENWWPAIQDGT